MTILQLKYFIQIVQCGSAAKAAEKNYISHQALSKQLRALEDELGFSLFDRSGKKSLSLTEEGKIMFDVWNDSIGRHEGAMEYIRKNLLERQRIVVVGIEDMPKLKHRIIDMFQKYSERNERLIIEYRIGTPNEVRHWLDTGQIDAAIMLSLSIDDYEKRNHRVLEAYEDKAFIAVSNTNPLAANKSITVDDLKNEVLVLISPDYSQVVAQRQIRDMEKNHISVKKKNYISNPEELRINLLFNNGIALIHEMLIEDIRDKVTLFPFDVYKDNEEYSLLILWNDERYKTLADSISEINKEKI